eukprot:1153097-Pelagomonas_calceolata.AAC.5
MECKPQEHPVAVYSHAGRNYEWTELSRHADLLFVMGYDMQAQIWGRCIASANDPLALVRNGLKQWLYLVPASVLYLKDAIDRRATEEAAPHLSASRQVETVRSCVPLFRYGYDYECVSYDGQADLTLGVGQQMQEACGGSPGGAGRGEVCELHPAEFRGAPCSDLVGAQRPIAELLQGGVIAPRGGTGVPCWHFVCFRAPQFAHLPTMVALSFHHCLHVLPGTLLSHGTIRQKRRSLPEFQRLDLQGNKLCPPKRASYM